MNEGAEQAAGAIAIVQPETQHDTSEGCASSMLS
jgi:hypothetical protein